MMSRKKATRGYDPYKDVVSNLEDVSACITKAERSSVACIDGILKANTAVEDTVMDPDLQCVALVKKAELVFIANKQKYNLEELPGDKRLYSLDKCIADCDKVLSESTGTSEKNPVYEKAKELHYKAWKLKEDLLKVKDDRNTAPRHHNRFNPSKTSFKNVEMINPSLLQDVVDCYRKSRVVCRMCYFKRHCIEPIPGHVCRGFKKNPPRLLIIPASKMCDNIAGTSEVPILSAPKFLLTPGNRHKPFQICKNMDHSFCESKASVGENRFAHSIEELVVWTIERHYSCTFMEYIDRYHRRQDYVVRPSPDPVDYEDIDTDDLYSDTYSEEDVDHDDSDFEYHPEEDDIVYGSVSDIPRNLLLSVIEKYRKMREYCKWCYYRNNEQGTATRDHQSDVFICSICKYQWNPVKVIPSSELCWNFGDFEFLPIAPWPNGKPKKDPFEYCQKKDHFRCFRVYVDSEFWYPHSVEEMVIWTVEREHRQSFKEYIQSLGHHPSSRKNDHQVTVNHGNASASSQNQNHSSSHSTSLATNKKDNPRNSEVGLPQATAASTGNKKVLLETPRGARIMQGPQHKAVEPSQPKSSYAGSGLKDASSEKGKLATDQVTTKPVTVQGANGVNGQGVVTAQAPDNAAMPGSTADNRAGSNLTQMPFQYQMYHSGGPRPMVFPAGMRPMVPLRPPMNGGHQQNLSQPQAAPHLYGMHPGTFYNAFLWQQQQASVAAAAGHKPVPMGTYPFATQEPNSKQGEAKMVGAPVLKSSVDQKDSDSVAEVKKASSGGNASTIEDNKSRNKTLPITSGRKNYTVAGQSEKKKNVSAGVGTSGSGTKDDTGGGGDDSGLGVEVGSSNSMNSSMTSGTGLVLHTSAGAPRLATKVVEANPKIFKFSEVNFKDIDDVPIVLIKSVALNFRKKKCVCRTCFFGERDLCEKDVGEMCSSGEHKWVKPIIVIPGCSQCDNEPSFQQGEHIPIFPLPPLATLRKCPNTNHHKCFTKALEKQLFQAHSVEELVVWLVESENECSMEDYAKELNMDSRIEGVSSPSLSVGSSLMSDPVSPLLQTSAAVPGTALGVSLPISPPLLAPQSPGAMYGGQKTSLGPSEPVKVTDMSSVAVENIHPVGWNPMMQPSFPFFQSQPPFRAQPPQQPLQPQSQLPHQPQPQPPLQSQPHSSRSRSPQPQISEHQEFTDKPPAKPLTKYNPKDIDFGCLEDIPPHLLSSIAECFKQMKLVCRTCFFTSNCSNRVLKNDKRNMCKKGHGPFKSIRVIPKSSLCMNKTAYISILPLPKHMKSSKNQFEICKKVDHSVCYAMSRDTNPWFPHTVEEIVVWIVERETGQSFESIYTKYLLPKNRSQVATESSKYTSATGTATPTKPAVVSAGKTDHSDAANTKVQTASSSVGDMVFSTDDDRIASNSQPFDNVMPLNPMLKTTIDSQVSPASFYMHSQQPLVGPPPPGYMAYFPSQAVPPVFQGFTYQGAAGIGTSGLGLRPPHPVVAGNGEQRGAESLGGETKPTLDGDKDEDFSVTWNGVVSESNGKKSPRNAVWYDEDPLPDSSMWSRVVGDKSEMSALPVPSLSPSLVDSKDVEDIVHRSQVDDDSFQPYATIKPPPVIPALKERSSARINDPSEADTSVMTLAQARDTFKTSLSGVAAGEVGSMFGGMPGEQDMMGGDSFLASAMAASVNAMSFPTGNSALRVSGSPQDDIYLSGSNSPEDMGATSLAPPPVAPPSAQFLFRCQLCHRRFQTSDELKSHGSSDLSHLELCLLDSGCEEVWRYSPPPPQRSQQMKVCSMPNCARAPHCNKPHSPEQLQEWRARIKHREQRKRTGAHLLGQVSPNLDSQRNSVPISTIPGFFVTVSDASSEPNNGYSWIVHIQGLEWLNLFGITVKTSSEWSFKITHVEGAGNSGVFHPHSPMWRAPLVHGHRVKQCLMLGSIQITIKALPPGSASRNWRHKDTSVEGGVTACVYLDLGYGQCFTVNLPSISGTDRSTDDIVSEGQRQTDQLNMQRQQQDQTVGAVGLQFDQLKFSPSPTHSWTIDSDFSDELGDLNIEGEDLTLQHVPIEEWGCSLTD